MNCPNCGAPARPGARFCTGCGAALPAAGPLPRDAQGALAPGAVLEGRYTIVRLLGVGGFGAVYLADDNRLRGRQCAIKELFDRTPEAQRQFELEASLLARLDHPQLVRVTDYFSTPAHELFLVMDYVPGEDLAQVLQRTPGFLPENQVVDWISQVCDVLTYMHTWADPATGQLSPIIHRDIKPGNLKLLPNGHVKVIDLGIAKVKEPGRPTTRAARAVSPPYSPLEQYGAGTDERSDVYALGVTLYELLTRQLPPEAPDLAHQPVPSPRQHRPDLSASVEQVIVKAMQSNPAQRFPTVRELAAALRGSALAARPQPAPAAAPTARALPPVIPGPAGHEWVLVPAGEFLMGSNEKRDRDASDDEMPQHQVYLDAYYIGRTPVTNAQYQRFVQTAGHPAPEHWKQGRIPAGLDDHPVVCVSWDDAVAYCQWLTGQIGNPQSAIGNLVVRLPTEAEWEKAARGTDGRIYPWGNDWDSRKCNSSEGVKGGTTPVGAYPAGASPYGCLDMAGNVWEWCADWYDENYYRNSPTSNPAGPNTGDGRVLRGGSWFNYHWGVRAAFRNWVNPGNRSNLIGFRCCLSPSSSL